MSNKTPEQVFQDFLLQLDTEVARQMLADLKDENLRGPQLYNAIDKLLNRHKFQITRFNPEEEVLQGLANTMNDYDKIVQLHVVGE